MDSTICAEKIHVARFLVFAPGLDYSFCVDGSLRTSMLP